LEQYSPYVEFLHPSNYQIVFAMALVATKSKSSGKRAGTIQYEVLLQEILTKAGCDTSPEAPPEVTRLACHMQLLQELQRAHSFGSLTGVMDAILAEIAKSLYTNEAIADPLAGVHPAARGGAARLPYFAALQRKQQEVAQLEAHARHLQGVIDGRSEADRRALEELQRASERRREMEGTIAKLEYQLAKAEDEAKRAVEEMEFNRSKDQASIQYLEQKLSLTKDALHEATEENKMMKSREEVEMRMREQFAAGAFDSGHGQSRESARLGQGDEAGRLIRQLLVLQNGRIEDFEARMASATSATIPSNDTVGELKRLFAAEMETVHEEIRNLYEHRKVEMASGSIYAEDKGDAEEDAEAEAGCADSAEAPEGGSQPTHTGRLWQAYQIRAGRNELFRSPMAVRNCSDKELRGAISRILEENFLRVCPYITPEVDTFRAFPRTRRPLCSPEELQSMLKNPDDAAREICIPSPDFFFHHLDDRYGCHEVAMLVAHSMLQAVGRLFGVSKKVAMFGKVIGGEVDDALWQYALQCQWLMENHPEAPQWQVNTQSHFEQFWRLLYPQLPSAEISAASKEVCRGQRQNSFSNSTVLEYIIQQLLNKVRG